MVDDGEADVGEEIGELEDEEAAAAARSARWWRADSSVVEAAVEAVSPGVASPAVVVVSDGDGLSFESVADGLAFGDAAFGEEGADFGEEGGDFEDALGDTALGDDFLGDFFGDDTLGNKPANDSEKDRRGDWSSDVVFDSSSIFVLLVLSLSTFCLFAFCLFPFCLSPFDSPELAVPKSSAPLDIRGSFELLFGVLGGSNVTSAFGNAEPSQLGSFFNRYPLFR
jgi:hypothetical protein